LLDNPPESARQTANGPKAQAKRAIKALPRDPLADVGGTGDQYNRVLFGDVQ
jgi:hypothetical protein